MDSLPVFVADWEMQCCGEPFSIGTEVRWRLEFLYEDEISAPIEALLPPDSVVTAAATASIADPDAAEGLRGVLNATWHGTGGDRPTPPVAGTVRRIRLVRQFTVREDRLVTVIRVGARLTELTTSRDRFARGSMRTPEGSWEETGLLVDLATDLGEVIASVSG
ncbi:hypothetical protein GA0115240_15474 [Streptomyces sp. DvalAA-14]|uniref:DUF6578 domain-containing protein n=1 Tax=unclassified Streptomyces TaxID=2593676 RepID=UPI00081B306B|nr:MULTISPECIES: DUF6578 domain-containing protein [unclassified Streptomyces]MYS23616.1 hypothetical protein [Streptomyces sp. SID4948]SCE36242.1 hypothetical protein GA0115240_15474 [Streptomyces sp. DvalAA-14]